MKNNAFILPLMTTVACVSLVCTMPVIRSSLLRLWRRMNVRMRRLRLQLSPLGAPLPPQVHYSLQGHDLNNSILIIGDIHGCSEELEMLLDKCSKEYGVMESELTVISVGDLVNKGPNSVGVVERFSKSSNFYAVRGNHDELILSRWYLTGRFEGRSQKAQHQRDKYDWVEDSFSQRHIQWLSDLPYTISIPSRKLIIVHAGLEPDLALEDQKLQDMVNVRDIAVVSEENRRTLGENEREDPEGDPVRREKPWATIWKGPTHVYFGHDAKRGLQLEKHATGIDTGCVYGKKLTGFLLPQNVLVSVDAKKMYTKPKG